MLTWKSRFQSHYENVLRYDLAEKLCVSNSYQTPKIEKIILSASVSFKPQQVRGLAASSKSNSNIGRLAPTSKRTKGKSMKGRLGGGIMPSMGSAIQGLENCTLEVRNALMLLSGQTLDSKTFRVSRPQLGIRKGRLAAYQVTLRNESMYLFLERLLTEVLPKIIKTDPAVLITSTSNLQSKFRTSYGSSDRRLQRTSIKVANFKIVDFENVPFDTIWLNDGSQKKEVIKSFFDGNGNFQLGIPDFYVFREIEQNIEFTKLNGLNVTIVTSAKTDREARLLLSGFQAPFTD